MREGKKTNFLFTYLSSVAAASVSESSYSKKRGMFKTAAGIVKHEGILKLWSGLSPAVARNCLNTRIATYELLRNHVFLKNPDGSFPVWKGTLAGFIAGSIGKIMAVPFDSVKVKMQMQGIRKPPEQGEPLKPVNFLKLFAKRYREGGIRALWKGAVPSVTRAGIMNIADILTYDRSKRYFIKNCGFRDALPLHFICGMVAGFVTALVACPIDVVKARIMNQPTEHATGKGYYYSGSIDCLRKTVKHEGVLGLYKGFTPFFLRVGPSIIIIWVVVEYIRLVFDMEGF